MSKRNYTNWWNSVSCVDWRWFHARGRIVAPQKSKKRNRPQKKIAAFGGCFTSNGWRAPPEGRHHGGACGRQCGCFSSWAAFFPRDGCRPKSYSQTEKTVQQPWLSFDAHNSPGEPKSFFLVAHPFHTNSTWVRAWG